MKNYPKSKKENRSAQPMVETSHSDCGAQSPTWVVCTTTQNKSNMDFDLYLLLSLCLFRKGQHASLEKHAMALMD